ncbi:MAG: SPOR domain-containing protein [Desulfobacteraceae bacterium]
MLLRILVFTLFSTLSSLALISSLPADQDNFRSGEVRTISSANSTAVTIQVSSFKKQDEAEKEIVRLKSHGVDAKTRYESVPGKGMWYRVYVGRFQKKSEARTYAESLKAKGIITWSWIKPNVFPHAVVKTTAQSSSAPKLSSRKAFLPRSAPPAPPALPQKQVHKKVESGEKQPAPLVKQAVPATAPTQQALKQRSTANAASGQNQPAMQAASTKRWTQFALPGTFNFSSQTTLQALQRDTSTGEDSMVLPLYEYIRLDYGNTEEGGLAFHAYGWGRSDLADSAYFEDTSDGELLFGYLEYSKPYSDLHLVLGRQLIFAGVTNDTVDGLRFSAGLGDMLTATLFGGVTYAADDAKADTTYGSRIAFHPRPAYVVAISYQDTAAEGDPDQRAGVDFSFNWSDWITVQGLSSYNLDSGDWREHQYSAALRYKAITLEPAYQFFSYKDYFDVGKEENNLFHFLKDTDEQVAIAGADFHYQWTFPVRLSGRYHQYTYSIRQEKADYYAALIGVDLSKGSQLGGEVGRMDGESDDNIYALYRIYFYWADPLGFGSSAFVSGDAIFQNYDAPVYGKDYASYFSLSGGMRLFDDRLEVKLTGTYSQDPYFDDNMEGLLTFRIDY